VIDPADIEIDLSRDAIITPLGHLTLHDRYMVNGETSPQQAFARVCAAFGDDLEHAQRLYEYASKQWFGFATPVLANGGTRRGLPISCFLNDVEDSRGGILQHYTENGWLSSVGGGIGAYVGGIRSNGQKTRYGSESSGLIPFIKPMDSIILAFAQGSTRRGSYAAYVDIDHPEVEEFIVMRKPQGGDSNRKTLNLHHGLMVSDAFMAIIDRCTADRDADDSWPLVDPHTNQVVKTISARALWRSILETRIETGEPYLIFSGAVNRAFPPEQTALGLRCKNSNLCTEITLATGQDIYGRKRTAVCCLSSLNLATYAQWGGKPCEQLVEDMLRMLDNVLTSFITLAPPELGDAVYSASRERSVGLGVMGWHTFLQDQSMPFDSDRATFWNDVIFRRLRAYADKANAKLAIERGPCPDSLEGGQGDKRFMHVLAIAPNATSSIICGEVSPGIEPSAANAFTSKTLSGSGFVKNKLLQKLLAGIDQDTDEVWSNIVTRRGSVQHLDFLTSEQKLIFRTAMEIDQLAIIKLAAQRTPYICQAASTNLFFAGNANVKDVHFAHLAAWKFGLKSLYYCRSKSVRSAEILSHAVVLKPIEMSDIEAVMNSDCVACQG
jgi:ribonucleoside-diphosphate reductase alpha chain